MIKSFFMIFYKKTDFVLLYFHADTMTTICALQILQKKDGLKN